MTSHIVTFSVSMAALSLRRSSWPDSSARMMSLSCCCAEAYRWK